MPGVSMRQMLEAGVHFGHQTRFWNPKMAPFIFGERNKIHIINLEKTQPMYAEAANFIKGVIADGGTVLFVGTKRSARESIQKEAERAAPAVREPALARRHAHELQDHPPVDQAARRDHRAGRFRRAGQARQEGGDAAAARDGQAREEPRRHQAHGVACPDALFVVDVGHENIAIHEAKKLGIPVVGDRRHQLLPRRHRLRDPRQRRRHARHPALCRRHRRRGARGQGVRAAGRRGRGRVRRARRGRQSAQESARAAGSARSPRCARRRRRDASFPPVKAPAGAPERSWSTEDEELEAEEAVEAVARGRYGAGRRRSAARAPRRRDARAAARCTVPSAE